MNLQKSQDRINELMSRFVAQVKGAKAMRRTDINCVSEDVLIPLFSEVYGHTDLRNLNVSEGPNFPAIDLGDEKTRTAYQITSRFRSEKVKDTVKKFVEYKLYEKFERLVIYILTEKPETYHGRGLDDIIQDKFSFDKDTDILDYRDLLEKISGFPLDKLRRVEGILEQQFGDESHLNQESTNPLDWLAQVNDSWIENSATFKINREKLLNELLNFASGGNGVIIGQAGVGKSYLLKELHYALESANRLHLLLPIDKLRLDAPDKLWQELSDERAMINKLKSVPTSCQKSILLFDAFDAARDEQTRQHFLNLIRRAIHTLKDSWNVVVTVRTYDAMKSQELLDLFGTPDDTEYQSKDILCRHLTIPPLNEDEIQQAFDQIPQLESLSASGSEDFRCLLKNPFNLWLLEKILKTSQDVRGLSQIHSEVQLLGEFWRRRVDSADNDFDRVSVLTQVAHCMVKERTLDVRQQDIYEVVAPNTPAKQTAWNELQSDEILTKVSSTKQRIAFTHNILFDYAISVLLIEDDPQQLENFVLADLSRPLFLRPSLTYFFTRLWYKAPDTFWNVFWHVFPSNQSVHLRLVARLIPTSVIANEAREIGQLTPLLDKLEQGEEIAIEAIMWLLQSIRALEIKRDLPWIDFFDKVSEHLRDNFAWDLATLTSEIFEHAREAENATVMHTCGRIGRRILKWIWKERRTGENDWYYRLASSWAVPLVAKTYSTSPEESRKLLEKVLKLTREDDFPIDLITRLTEHVDRIWDKDPEFVVSTYVTVFAHQEISDEITNPMGGRILALTSTRRQDYSMCHYWLAQHIPNFLQAKPIAATRAVIRSLNFYIIHTQILDCLREAVNLQDMVEPFGFQGKTAYFLPDLSHMWDDREMLDEPIEMADALFEFILELATTKESISRLNSLLDAFRDEVWVAFFWKRLLNAAGQYPKVFAPRLIDLCIAKPILAGNDTLFELGEFLYAAWLIFTPNQRIQVENAILGLTSEAGNNRAFLEGRRNKLLARIPSTLLCTRDAKKIRADMERENSVPENRPLVSFSSSFGTYSDEEWLQDQGVDVTTSENKELQRVFFPLDEFRSNWLNKAPTEEATVLILPLLREAYAILGSGTEADKEVIDRLWYKLTACTAILGRVAGDAGSHLFDFCRKVLLDGATHEMPTPNSEQDALFDSSAYSPFPRHEAASGLLRLIAHQSEPDSEILDAIESLANDPVPSVRMVTAMELLPVYVKRSEMFWEIVEGRATHETNYVVLEWLCVTLTRIVGVGKDEEDKTIRVMGMMLNQLIAQTEKVTPPNRLIELFMWFTINRENPWARKKIEDILFKSPVHYAHSLKRAVSWVMKEYVVPKNLETSDGREAAKRSIVWLGEVITVVASGIKSLRADSAEHGIEERRKELQDLYKVIDEVIMRLYFAVAHEKKRSEVPVEEIPHNLRHGFYDEVKPLMEQVIDFALDGQNGVMFAKTAFYFMRLLSSFQSYNPKEVLHFAERVARSSERFEYNLDSLAVENVVKFVETLLADYRDEVREGQALEDLLKLIEIFVKAGWSDALRLVWRLDEVFR